MKCACNHCGANILLESDIKFINCPNCQNTLKVINSGEIIYTQVVDNQILVSTQIKNLVSEEEQKKQTELENLYRELGALNQNWANEIPKYRVQGTTIGLFLGLLFFVFFLLLLMVNLWFLTFYFIGEKPMSLLGFVIPVIFNLVLGNLAWKGFSFYINHSKYQKEKNGVEAKIKKLKQQ